MASFYDNASIITIPSGYKVGTLYSAKPTDGTGDMTFTRTGDTATRVNSAGIIERCITNLALQSNVFSNASWTKTNTTIGTGITDPNGGTTAFSLAGSSATSNTKTISQSPFTSSSDIKTFSIYAKANTHSFFQIRTSASASTNFDLTNGTFQNGSQLFGSITSIGGGWYRCQVTSTSATANTAVLIQLVDSLSAAVNEASTTTNSIYIWRAQAQTGDFATNYIDTTTAAVTQGPVTNLPRLDYLGSTCPQLLMEPTRTNLATYSQMFDNSIWGKVASTTITANATTSPDGYTNADLVTGGGSSTLTRIVQTFTAVSGTTYAFSAFVKQGPDNAKTGIRMISSANANIAGIAIVFTGGVPAITANGIALNIKSENYGNGWYRISGTYVAPISETNRFAYYSDTDGTNKSSYLWGAQVEAGAYATSYIPTTAATVTRNQDLFAKSSITSLLGQTEGTLFLDFTFDRQFVNADVFSLNDASILNRVSIGVTASNTLSGLVDSGGSNQATITSTIAVGTRYKCAIAYKANDFVLYVNGVQAGTDTSGIVPASLTRISNDAGTTSTTPFDYPMNQALVFKTRLTNAELATLTTL